MGTSKGRGAHLGLTEKKGGGGGGGSKGRKLFGALRTVWRVLAMPTSPCRVPSLPAGPSDSPAPGSRVIGTLFGYRKGHVHLAVQESAKATPMLLLELATPTSTLVKEMASGLVRIALECDKAASAGAGAGAGKRGRRLHEEPVWSMYCNGKKTGYAMKKACSESDVKVLSLVQAVSMGAGVVPTDDVAVDGELMYMRARFERVVGSRDSEALYMINPDGSGGPELSIFFLRI